MIEERDKIEIIQDRWFMEEPAYFLVQSMFKMEYNDEIMKLAVGPKNIFINKTFADSISVDKLDAMLRVECVRILLRHPFTRYSSDRDKILSFVASESVIGTICHIKGVNLYDISDYMKRNGVNRKMDTQMAYEEVYKKLKQYTKIGKFARDHINGDEMAVDNREIESETKYWPSNQDDADVCSGAIATVNRIIDHIRATGSSMGKGIGSLHGDVVSAIEAGDPPYFDYKEPLRRFRHSVIESNKH